MYLKYINNISKGKRIILSIAFWLLSFLSLSIFLSVVIDDGTNELAKLFYITEFKEEINPHYEQVKQWAISSAKIWKIDDTLLEGRLGVLDSVIPKTQLVEISKQHPALIGTTASLLLSFFYIFTIHATLINTINYQFIQTTLNQGKIDGLITKERYEKMIVQLEAAQKEYYNEKWKEIKEQNKNDDEFLNSIEEVENEG